MGGAEDNSCFYEPLMGIICYPASTCGFQAKYCDTSHKNVLQGVVLVFWEPLLRASECLNMIMQAKTKLLFFKPNSKQLLGRLLPHRTHLENVGIIFESVVNNEIIQSTNCSQTATRRIWRFISHECLSQCTGNKEVELVRRVWELVGNLSRAIIQTARLQGILTIIWHPGG